ncbi:MAG: autotransporter domain-containing protein, partial [Pseudomonadota bacterium]
MRLLKNIVALNIAITCALFTGNAHAVHIDIVVEQQGNQLTAGFCSAGSPGCNSLDVLAVVGVPAGTLPVHGTTGQQIFVTDFGDFAGGPFGVDDPGFFSGAGSLPANQLLRYRAVGSLSYWDPKTDTWVNSTPLGEQVRLAGGLEQVITDPSACGGLIICGTFNASSTLFTSGGISGPESLIVDNTQADGSLHTHLDWFIETAGGAAGGSEGAYLVELAMQIDGRQDSDPFHILFNRGMNNSEFAQALLALIGSGGMNINLMPIGAPVALPEFNFAGGDLGVPFNTTFAVDSVAGAPSTPFALAVGSLTGFGSVDLGTQNLVVQPAVDSDFDGVLFGDGDLIVRGTPGTTFTIDGFLGQSGWTVVETGTLAFAGTGNISEEGRVLVDANGTLDISAADGRRSIAALMGLGAVNLGANELRFGGEHILTEFTGSITGTGGITKTGNGEHRLLGANSYTGETRIEAGTLTVIPAAISATVVNNGELHFAIDAVDSTYGGTISGSGGVSKSGSGVLTLAGASSYQGRTSVSGPLAIFSDNNLGVGGDLTLSSGELRAQNSLRLDRDVNVFGDNTIDTGMHSVEIAGLVSGTGNLIKRGDGTLTLAGGGTQSGLTSILEGRLRFNADIGGHVFAAPGTSFSGHGAISGNLWLMAGSTLEVAVSPGHADQITVGGRADIAGANLRISAAPGRYPTQSLYPLLTAGTGVFGRFGSVTSNLAFLDTRIEYDPNRVWLHLVRNDQTFMDFASGPNESAAAAALESMLTTVNGDTAAVVQGLQVLSVEEVPEALNTISGASNLPIPAATQAQSRAAVRQIGNRLRGLSGFRAMSSQVAARDDVLLAMANDSESGDPAVLGAAMQAASTLRSNDTHGLWLRALVGFGDFDLSGTTTAEGDNAGVIAGYDMRASDSITLGVYGLYSDSEINQFAPVASTSVTGWQAGGYARWQGFHWHAEIIGGYGNEQYDSTRNIQLGLIDSVASAEFDGSSGNVYTEFGYST